MTLEKQRIPTIVRKGVAFDQNEQSHAAKLLPPHQPTKLQEQTIQTPQIPPKPTPWHPKKEATCSPCKIWQKIIIHLVWHQNWQRSGWNYSTFFLKQAVLSSCKQENQPDRHNYWCNKSADNFQQISQPRIWCMVWGVMCCCPWNPCFWLEDNYCWQDGNSAAWFPCMGQWQYVTRQDWYSCGV